MICSLKIRVAYNIYYTLNSIFLFSMQSCVRSMKIITCTFTLFINGIEIFIEIQVVTRHMDVI